MGKIACVEPGGRRIWGYAAASVLATITLGVFYVLQDYGPESAIRRYHQAILKQDRLDLQRVSVQEIDSENSRLLAREVGGFLAIGNYQLVRMERTPGEVRAGVVYRPRGTQDVFPMIWIVEKKGGVWKVNVDKTLTILRDSLGI